MMELNFTDQQVPIIDLKIELDEASGLITAVFHNDGDKTIKLRGIYEPYDVIIENDNGVRAQFWLQIFSAEMDCIILKPSHEDRRQINLLTDFIYPTEGVYSVWIDYDSSKTGAMRLKEPVDAVQLKSNKICFPITFPEP